MPTPTITIRLPSEVRAALETRASEEAMALRTFIVQTLATAVGLGTVVLDRTGKQFVSPSEVVQTPGQSAHAPVATNVRKMEPRAVVVVDERNVRHLSPTAAAARTDVAKGYEVAESECAHPKDRWKVFSYMTKCLDCGRRLR